MFPSPDGAWIVTLPLLYPETMRVVKAQSANLIKITPVLPSFWQKYRSIPGTLRGANFPENGCVLGVRTKAVLCPGNRFSGQHFEADAFSKLFCRCFSQPLVSYDLWRIAVFETSVLLWLFSPKGVLICAYPRQKMGILPLMGNKFSGLHKIFHLFMICSYICGILLAYSRGEC